MGLMAFFDSSVMDQDCPLVYPGIEQVLQGISQCKD